MKNAEKGAPERSGLAAARARETALTAALFLAPAFLILIVFIFYPIVSSFITSAYDWNGISPNKTFIGIANWKRLLADSSFWAAFRNNVVIMILSICVQIPIGVALATFLDFAEKHKISKVFKVIWFLPLLMSSVAIGFLFTYALATNGGMISALSHLFGGGNVDLLGNPKTALLTVIAVICWQFAPFYMVYATAAFTNISYDIYEASVIDGATRAQYFRKIALPLIVPYIKNAAIMSMVGSLKYFDLIYVMTGGGPGTATELMATYMYKQSFRNFSMGYGSAVACGMFILISVIAIIFLGIVNKRGEED